MLSAPGSLSRGQAPVITTVAHPPPRLIFACRVTTSPGLIAPRPFSLRSHSDRESQQQAYIITTIITIMAVGALLIFPSLHPPLPHPRRSSPRGIITLLPSSFVMLDIETVSFNK